MILCYHFVYPLFIQCWCSGFCLSANEIPGCRWSMGLCIFETFGCCWVVVLFFIYTRCQKWRLRTCNTVS
ncbi:hypothetical protein ACB092_01G043300 [Castanea dentata]